MIGHGISTAGAEGILGRSRYFQGLVLGGTGTEPCLPVFKLYSSAVSTVCRNWHEVGRLGRPKERRLADTEPLWRNVQVESTVIMSGGAQMHAHWLGRFCTVLVASHRGVIALYLLPRATAFSSV